MWQKMERDECESRFRSRFSSRRDRARIFIRVQLKSAEGVTCDINPARKQERHASASVSAPMPR